VEDAACPPDVGRDLLHADRLTRPAPPPRRTRARRWRTSASREVGPRRPSPRRVDPAARPRPRPRPRPAPVRAFPTMLASPENTAHRPRHGLEPCRTAELPTGRWSLVPVEHGTGRTETPTRHGPPRTRRPRARSGGQLRRTATRCGPDSSQPADRRSCRHDARCRTRRRRGARPQEARRQTAGGATPDTQEARRRTRRRRGARTQEPRRQTRRRRGSGDPRLLRPCYTRSFDSSISVTRAAIADLSERVSVT